jgi:hypothetical protein
LNAGSESDRRDAERALSSAVRRSPPSVSSDVAGAYKSASNTAVRASLLQVMGQAGTKEVMPVVLAALGDSNPELVRAAILALTEWPDEQPLRELLAFAGKTATPAHQVLSLRGALKLMELPTNRSNAESVTLLSAAPLPDRRSASDRGGFCPRRHRGQ